MTGTSLLHGGTVIVTGGSRGIGASVARFAHAHGARVGLIARHSDALSRVAADLTTAGTPSVAHVAVDVADPDALRRAVEALIDQLGPPTMLVNNAGMISRTRAEQIGWADWHQVLDTNLGSALAASVTVAPHMREAGGGSIVNIASLSAHFGVRQAASYGASKSGLLGLTRALALEWASDNIRVNAVTPGYISTEFTHALAADPERSDHIRDRIPLGRWGAPEDIAGTVIYLGSPLATYVTGQVVVVDGGYSVDG